MAEKEKKPSPLEDAERGGEMEKEPEMKTMKRDLARLRLEEAEEEREKIIGLQKEEAPPSPPSEATSQKEEEQKVEKELKKRGKARKKAASEAKKEQLEKELASLKEKEREINKKIQNIETSKKAVQNETEKKNLQQKQKDLKKRQARIQQEITANKKEIRNMRKEVAEVSAPPEEKEKKEGEKEKLTGIEKAKKRLESLSKEREKRERGKEEKYKRSLEKRWKKKKKKAKQLPSEVREPVKGRRRYPEKPSPEKRRLVRIFVFGFLGLVLLGGGWLAFTKITGGVEFKIPAVKLPEIRIPVFTCGGYEKQERCETAGCFWYENACHKKEKPEKKCADFATKKECQKEGCFWYGTCRREKKKCVRIESQKFCQREGCFWYENACHKQQKKPEKPLLPPALIPLDRKITLEVKNEKEVAEKLEELTGKDLGEDETTEVLFKNTEENKYLTIKEFLNAFGAGVPDPLFRKAEEKGTLFIHSSVGRNRLGFVTRVEEPTAVSGIMRDWESSMESDLENLLSSLGKEEEAVTTRFRETSFYNTRFKYLTISHKDFGLCYTVVGDYLVFTTSFAGMKNTLLGLQQMEDLSKKAGQLFILGFEGKKVTSELESFIEKYKPGGLLLLSKNIENKSQLSSLISELQKLSRKKTGVPLFIAVDQEGGEISRIPFLEEKRAQKEFKSEKQAREAGRKRGRELKKLGVNLNLAPVMDVTEEGDFLHSRTFQKETDQTGRLGKAMVEGQSQAGILTAVKHFPGHAGIKENPEQKQTRVETLPPVSQFRKAEEAEPEFVMTANVVYENLDSESAFTFSKKGIHFLKKNLGADTVVMSDDLAQTYLLEKRSLQDLVAEPLKAGVDCLIFSGYEIDARWGPEALFQAIAKKRVSEQTIERAYRRIMKIKQKLYY